MNGLHFSSCALDTGRLENRGRGMSPGSSDDSDNRKRPIWRRLKACLTKDVTLSGVIDAHSHGGTASLPSQGHMKWVIISILKPQDTGGQCLTPHRIESEPAIWDERAPGAQSVWRDIGANGFFPVSSTANRWHSPGTCNLKVPV